jgi:hypothetical protein
LKFNTEKEEAYYAFTFAFFLVATALMMLSLQSAAISISWDLMPGGAVRIGGSFSVPWIVNNSNQIFRWNN